MEVSVYHSFLSENNSVQIKQMPHGPVNIGVNGTPSNYRSDSVRSERPYTRAYEGDQIPLCWDDQLKQRDVRVMTAKSADSMQRNLNTFERHTLTYDHANNRTSRPKICDRVVDKQFKDNSNGYFFRQTKVLHGSRAVDHFLWKQEDRKESASCLDIKSGPGKRLDNDEELQLPLIRLKQAEKSHSNGDAKSPILEVPQSESEGITKVHVTQLQSPIHSPRGADIAVSGTPVKSILKQSSNINGPAPSAVTSPRVMFRNAPDLTVVASTSAPTTTNLQSRPFSQPPRSRTAPATMMSHPRLQSMRGLVRGFYLHKSTAAQGASFVPSQDYGKFGERPLFFNFVSQPVTERKMFSYGKSSSVPTSRRSRRNYFCNDHKVGADMTFSVDDVDVDRVPELEFQRKSSEPGEAPALPNTPVSAAAFTNVETEESETELEVPHVKVTFGDRRERP